MKKFLIVALISAVSFLSLTSNVKAQNLDYITSVSGIPGTITIGNNINFSVTCTNNTPDVLTNVGVIYSASLPLEINGPRGSLAPIYPTSASANGNAVEVNFASPYMYNIQNFFSNPISLDPSQTITFNIATVQESFVEANDIVSFYFSCVADNTFSYGTDKTMTITGVSNPVPEPSPTPEPTPTPNPIPTQQSNPNPAPAPKTETNNNTVVEEDEKAEVTIADEKEDAPVSYPNENNSEEKKNDNNENSNIAIIVSVSTFAVLTTIIISGLLFYKFVLPRIKK